MEELLARWLDGLDAGRPGDALLHELCAAEPQHAESLRRRVALLAELGVLTPAADTDESAAVPERLGRFRILHPLGRGGMGVVYAARDEELGREVALKLVRPDQLFQPGVRARFRREVGIIARLAHPGIVPVYAVGEADGVPYFAMERVRGCSLDRTLAHLRASDVAPAALRGVDLGAAVSRVSDDAPVEPGSQDPPARDDAAADDDWLFAGSWEQACVRVVRLLAEALEHAHRRGVVHRDIKPSNVMLSCERDGNRARLLDFGLASTHGTASELTRSGSRLGSLHYMSPEQTRGEFASVGPRSDVYSLGVTLYEMLGLTRPFAADDEHAVIEAIRAGAAPSVRELNSTLSWEVATVCARAMDRDAERRYASAEDFARDLGNVLAHRPVEARPAPPWRRARRWVQRRPTLAVSLALGTLLLVGAPLLFVAQQLDANAAMRAQLERTEEQRLAAELAGEEARRARDAEVLARQHAENESERATLAQQRAEANQDLALDAVDRMLTRLASRELRYLPQMEQIRVALLEDAVALSGELLASAGDDPAARLAAASALDRRGELLASLGRSDSAVDDLRAAAQLYAELAAAHPDDAALATLEAGATSRLAMVRYRADDAAGAEAVLREQQARLAEARAAHPLDLDLVHAVARNEYQLGVLQSADVDLREPESYADAEASWARAVRTLAPHVTLDSELHTLPEDDPARARGMRLHAQLAQVLDTWGQMVLPHFDRHEPGARELLERSLEQRERAAELAPHDADQALAVLSTRLNLASVLRHEGDHLGALAVCEDALPGLDALVAERPELILPRVELATVHNQIGLSHDHLGQEVEALQAYTQARDQLAELVQRAPGLAELHARLGVAELNVGAKTLNLPDFEGARAHFEQAVAQQLQAIQLRPGDLGLRQSLQTHRVAQFDLAVQTDDLPAAALAARLLGEAAPDEWRGHTRSAAHSARVVSLIDAGAGAALVGEAREQLRAEAVTQALASLQRALDAGFPHPQELAEVDALDPLRDDPGFQALLDAALGASGQL